MRPCRPSRKPYPRKIALFGTSNNIQIFFDNYLYLNHTLIFPFHIHGISSYSVLSKIECSIRSV